MLFYDIIFFQADTSILEAETILTSLQGEGVFSPLKPESSLSLPSQGVEGGVGSLAGVQSLLSSCVGEGKGVDLPAREPVSLGKSVFFRQILYFVDYYRLCVDLHLAKPVS